MIHNVGEWRIARKAADQSKNNDSTYGDDNHLKFYMAASTSYIFQMMLVTTSPAAADLTIAWTYPVGATATWGKDVDTVGQYDITTGVVLSASASIQLEPLIMGLVNCGATAGLFNLKWKQQVATVGNTTIHLGSCIQYAGVG